MLYNSGNYVCLYRANPWFLLRMQHRNARFYTVYYRLGTHNGFHPLSRARYTRYYCPTRVRRD